MHTFRKRTATTAALVALVFISVRAGGDPPRPLTRALSPEIIGQIRQEAFERSQVMTIARYLTDVTGPRLTNSSNMRQAQAYAQDLLQSWGVTAHLERWGPFGRGWVLRGIDVSLTAPNFAPLIAYPKAWSPGTNGPIAGEPVLFDPQSPSDVSRYRGQLRGRIVLFSPARPIAPLVVPARLTDAFLLNLADAQAPVRESDVFRPTPAQQAEIALSDAKWRLLATESPAVVIEASRSPSGSVYVTAAEVPSDPVTGRERQPWDTEPTGTLSQLVMAPEHYNRLVRLLQMGVPVSMRVNVAVQFDDDDPMSANLVGEFPGTDLRDQIVMFGGQFDSWHTATGAADNASGAAAALEAMRILRALDLHPRRSIRIGLWSGEEQGELGSRAYVSAHFGRLIAESGQTRLERGPEYSRLSGYFNLDGGAGRIRGIYLQGNEALRPIFRAWFDPFADLGASTLSIRSAAFTPMSFSRIGLPGFQFIRDFPEEGPNPGHTNMDVYDVLIPDDLKQAAAIMAAFAYQAAMRDELLPRPSGARQ